MATLTQSSSSTRTEKDSLGTKAIPADVYYGIQTARAVENYPISGMRAHPTLIKAFGMVKEAAAEANRELGLVDEKIANAIIQAAKEVAARQVGPGIRGRCFSGWRRRQFSHEHQRSHRQPRDRNTWGYAGRLFEGPSQ